MRADSLTVCYRKKQMDISFSCVCPAAVFLGKILYSHSASLHPGVKIGTVKIKNIYVKKNS